MLIITFACTCDACGKLVSHRSIPHPRGMLFPIPDRPDALGMDLCQECEELARGAVNEALEPRLIAMQARRSS